MRRLRRRAGDTQAEDQGTNSTIRREGLHHPVGPQEVRQVDRSAAPQHDAAVLKIQARGRRISRPTPPCAGSCTTQQHHNKTRWSDRATAWQHHIRRGQVNIGCACRRMCGSSGTAAHGQAHTNVHACMHVSVPVHENLRAPLQALTSLKLNSPFGSSESWSRSRVMRSSRASFSARTSTCEREGSVMCCRKSQDTAAAFYACSYIRYTVTQ